MPVLLRHQKLGPLLHSDQHVAPRVHPRLGLTVWSDINGRQVLRLNGQHLLRPGAVEQPYQTRNETLGNLRIAVGLKPHSSTLVHFDL
uniref:Uncharacterized protein n=1 Tax=Rhizophora mucronata TaxID=61149 RepID=A0A2P2N2Q2_RHIMU